MVTDAGLDEGSYKPVADAIGGMTKLTHLCVGP